jgi:predicted Zn-dependent protease
MRLEREDPGRLEKGAGAELDRALFLAAGSRLRLGDSAGSLRLLRRLDGLDPGHPGLQPLLVDCLVAESGRLEVAGRSQEAASLLREAVGADAADGDLAFALAVSLMERGGLDNAISVLSDALLRHPDDPRLGALMERALRIRYPRGLAD